MSQVAKGGPSPVNGGLTEKQGERARLRNTGCATGALAGGPEPSAGGREGWFGSTGEGERVDAGGALRVAVAVLGAVDLVWWAGGVRLAYLCGRRDGEEPGRLGASYLGIMAGSGRRSTAARCARRGFASCRSMPSRATGGPSGGSGSLSARAAEVELHRLRRPRPQDRVSASWSAARTAARGSPPGSTPWTAPGFDAAWLVRLLRAEITDAELRAEDPDDEDDEDDPDAPLADDVWRSPFCAAELPELTCPPATSGTGDRRRFGSSEKRWIGTIKNDGSGPRLLVELRWYPPEGEKSTSRAPSPIEAADAGRRAWQHERRELVAGDLPHRRAARSPARCRPAPAARGLPLASADQHGRRRGVGTRNFSAQPRLTPSYGPRARTRGSVVVVRRRLRAPWSLGVGGGGESD